jgi:molecular chaperone DnaK (HSP70)
MPPPGYVKTLSAILYQGRQPIAWGWEARNRYRELDDRQRRCGEYVYLEQFKLALDKNSGYELPPGFTPVQVIADFLRMFKAHCLKLLGDLYTVGRVQWCLTVPAIWKDDQKDAMRRAAHLAGLIDTEASDRLSIIMEPEAAMLHAHGVRDLGSMAPGETVMMVDAGGGTVDLTVHTIRHRDGRAVLEEAAPGVGGFCGSTYVDKNFEAWFRAEVGAADFDAWKRARYAEYQQVAPPPRRARASVRASSRCLTRP